MRYENIVTDHNGEQNFIYSKIDFSHPRHTVIRTEADIAALPLLEREYTVLLHSISVGEETLANILVRVRPNRAKAALIEFPAARWGERTRRHICRIGELSFDQIKAVAQQMVEAAKMEGKPSKRSDVIRRDMPISEAWKVFQSRIGASPWAEIAMCEEWAKTFRNAMERYAISRFGHAPVPYLTKDRVRDLLETLYLLEPGQARTLLKVLKRFLNWCVDVGLAEYNALYRFKLAAPQGKRITLAMADIVKIMMAAGKIAGPWQMILILSVATTETIEDVRRMHSGDILSDRSEWWMKHKGDSHGWVSPGKDRVYLNEYALDAIGRIMPENGFLFQSSRKRDEEKFRDYKADRSVQWRSGVARQIRTLSGVPGEWTTKDLHRSVLALSGRKRAETMFVDMSAEERQTRIRIALQKLSDMLYDAIDRHLETTRAPLPEDEAII